MSSGWGPIVIEYYPGSEGIGFCVIGLQEWLAIRGSVGRSLWRGAHRRRRRQGAAGRRGGRGLVRDARASSTTTTRPRRPRPTTTGVVHPRRHRLSRHGGLSLSHRPGVEHDHLRRGQRVPAGGRGRPGPPLRPSPMWPSSACPTPTPWGRPCGPSSTWPQGVTPDDALADEPTTSVCRDRIAHSQVPPVGGVRRRPPPPAEGEARQAPAASTPTTTCTRPRTP